MDTVNDDVASQLEPELKALWRFALRLTMDQNDASDLVQKTCVRALEQRHSYFSSGKIRSWLFRIQHRIWINELRSRKIRNHSSLDITSSTVEWGAGNSAPVGHDTPVDGMETTLYLTQVIEAVERLPEAQRVVVQLVCVEGFGYAESADILDIPIGTVMSRLARARIAIGKFRLGIDIPASSRKTVALVVSEKR